MMCSFLGEKNDESVEQGSSQFVWNKCDGFPQYSINMTRNFRIVC